jgi:ATP synthase protein I
MNPPLGANRQSRTKHLPDGPECKAGTALSENNASSQARPDAAGKAAPALSEKPRTSPQESRPLSLTPQERARMNARAAKGLVNLVLAQSAMLLVAALISWVLAGGYAALSALAGGLVYLVPSSFAALHMLVKIYSQANASALTFFWTQALKIGGSLALLALVVKFAGPYLVWPALLVGLIVVLKGYVLLLMLNKLK